MVRLKKQTPKINIQNVRGGLAGSCQGTTRLETPGVDQLEQLDLTRYNWIWTENNRSRPAGTIWVDKKQLDTDWKQLE